MSLIRAVRLYGRLVSASIRAQMQYKVDFVISTFFEGLMQSIDFALLAAIMLRFPEIAGWNVYEIGLLYGMSWIAMSIYRTFAPELHDFHIYVIQGTFDSLLVRPWPTLGVLLSRNLQLRKLGGAIQGGIVFGISAGNLVEAGHIDLADVGLMLVLALIGSLIPFALSLATAALSFWIGPTEDLQTFTMFAPITASQYPLTVFPGWLKALLTSILPVAFISFVPVSYLLGKGGTAWSLAAGPAVSITCAVLAYRLWRLGERHYHSTGS